MSRTLQIANHTVSDGQPVFVIAEIGVNHDGSVARAIELVHHAAAAGADAIKLQLFTAQRLVHASAAAAAYQTNNCGATDQISLLRQYELRHEDVKQIIAAAKARGLLTLATPFSPADVETIQQQDIAAIKIASPDLVNLPLLRRCAAAGKPLLISTGASNADEIAHCADECRSSRTPFAFLHCVSSYPTAAERAHLGWIGRLRLDHPGVVVGYSDHTTEPMAGALAVAAGAQIIEKHLTWNRAAAGPDHAASADPTLFATYVRAIRLAEQMMHVEHGDRCVLPEEQDVRRLSRQSVVTCRAVAAGQPIGADDVVIQRPGTGIPAAKLKDVCGRRACAAIPAHTILQWEMLDAPALNQSSAA